MARWGFPLFDPDTLEPTNEEITLNKVDDYNAVAADGAVSIPMFDDTGYEWLSRYVHSAIDNKLQCPFVVTGKAGRGKSTFSIKLLRQTWVGFNPEHIHFWIDPFMESLEKNEEADPSIGYYPAELYDEAITGLFNQEWQSQTPQIKTTNIVRKKRTTIGYLTPNLGDINPKILPNMQFWAYMYRKGVAEIRFPYQNQFNGSVYWKPICAIAFTPLADEFWTTYERKKDSFIQEFLHGINKGEIGSRKYIQVVNQRDDLIAHVVDSELMKQNEIADVLNVKPNTVSMWLNRREKRRVGA